MNESIRPLPTALLTIFVISVIGCAAEHDRFLRYLHQRDAIIEATSTSERHYGQRIESLRQLDDAYSRR